MGNRIEMAKNLYMPLSATTQKLAFLGISGSGKTYGAGRFVEQLLEHDQQVVVVDTIGNWWGLRVGAEKGRGFSLPLLGGARGDVELAPTAGEVVADTIAGTNQSMILDVSDFTGGEIRRFVTAFATRLLAAKKHRPSPVMIVWEECQDIVPQFVRGESAALVGAVERLIKKGRNYGIGTTLISQRPQAVNKDVLNQVETLFAFRTVGRQERKAIEGWIVHYGLAATLEALPSLPTGDAFVWSPQWLKMFERVSVLPKVTFDASATPEFGKSRQTKLAPVNLDALRATMAEAIESARANDPDELRRRAGSAEKRVGELEARLKEAERLAHRKGVIFDREVMGAVADAEKLAGRVEKALDAMSAIAIPLRDAANALRIGIREMRASSPPQVIVEPNGHGGTTITAVHPRASVAQHERLTLRHAPPRDGVNDGGGMGRCEREILIALARRHPTQLTRTQVATLSGYSQNSSGFANAIARVNVLGHIVKNGSLIGLSKSGAELVGNVERPPLLDIWAAKLPPREGQILRSLVERGRMTRDEIAKMIGLSVTSSGFANYIAHLNSNGLISKGSDGAITAAAELSS